MEWFFKAVLTAGMVLLVTLAARRGGPRIAGAVAALPTITAPTLAWLAHERGLEFAASAAIGSVASCAMLAAFALAYALTARRAGLVAAMISGVAGALAAGLPAFAASTNLGEALVLAVGCSALALAAIPDTGPRPRRSRMSSHRSLATIAIAAGALTALAATLGPALGSFATGLLASLPLISGAAAMVEHANGGHRAAAQFLRGYLWGLFGKAAFGAVFALLAVPLGAVAALLLAFAFACVLSSIGMRPRSTEAKATVHASEHVTG